MTCKRGHPLTDDNVYVAPNGHRTCKTHYFAAQVPGTTVGFFSPGPEWVAAFHSRVPA